MDSLIKGDVDAMEKAMNEAVKKYNRSACFMWIFAIVFFLLAIWAAFQWSWGWGGDHMAPTVAFLCIDALVLYISVVYAERIKKEHDLATYKEVLAFSRGEAVDRDTVEGRRERAMKPWVKGVRASVQILIGAAIGGAIGIGLAMLAEMLA